MPKVKTKLTNMNSESSHTHPKTMILSLEPPKHEWVKKIAEATGIAQPKVVNLVLDEAIKNPVQSYIEQIEATQRQARLQQLAAQKAAIEAEEKQLKGK